MRQLTKKAAEQHEPVLQLLHGIVTRTQRTKNIHKLLTKNY